MLAKARKLVLLAVLIAAVGLFFSGREIWRSFNPYSETVSFETSGENRNSKLEKLANYPDPSEFQQINYDGKDLTGQNIITFETRCSDKYVTALFFPADTDYRQDPARAVINKAFECPLSGSFIYEISFADFKNLSYGRYYGFLADQGVSDLWYNPR